MSSKQLNDVPQELVKTNKQTTTTTKKQQDQTKPELVDGNK